VDVKRLVAVSDFHCGHVVGLTPPQYGRPEDDTPHAQKLRSVRLECWRHYAAVLRSLRPIDVLVVNGDAIDGKGHKSGGTELIRSSLQDQVDMAAECIAEAQAKHVHMVYGTAYHVSEGGEDFESMLADKVGAEIGGHEWLRINGVTFDCKHHVGSSAIPHGRATAISREMLWGQIWAQADLQPLADWTLRGHVHYCEGRFQFIGNRQHWGMTLPALQGMGSKFGSRVCSGMVHFGLVHWDIDNKGGTTWQTHVAALPSQKATARVY
jgi:hypothetical protein